MINPKECCNKRIKKQQGTKMIVNLDEIPLVSHSAGIITVDDTSAKPVSVITAGKETVRQEDERDDLLDPKI
ncbi:hypothetical protein NPIL_223821 [Nephila pilipes]|uniref:Uncharacterized protein n=1 Tax=Nephila pilipes TaxID=299642 RepID=A0A8X6TG57_NEPPI|nr:hypothetical protein NPIL_223821 [Nephila pilipes]